MKESEELMDELREVASDSLEACQAQGIAGLGQHQGRHQERRCPATSTSKTKRNPMILPVIMEV